MTEKLIDNEGEIPAADTNLKDESFRISRRRKWLDRAILVVSALIFAAAFPPLDLGFIGWAGILPLFLVVKNMTWPRAWRSGFLWGFVGSSASFFWLGEIESFNQPFAGAVHFIKGFLPFFNGGLCLPYIMAAVLGLFPAFWAMAVPLLFRYMLKPVPVQLQGYDAESSFNSYNRLMEIFLVFALAALWAVLEWIRTWVGTGLPWNFLAATQWQNFPLLQICEYTGVYGVSFIMAAVNIAFAFAVLNWKDVFLGKSKYKRPFPLIITIALIMIFIISGSRSMLQYGRGKGQSRINVAVLQGDIAQCRAASDEEAANALNTYLKLSELAVMTRPDLVIWPETAVPYPYRSSHSLCLDYRFRLGELVQKAGIPFLIGTVDFEDLPSGSNREPKVYNSALFLDPSGKIAGKYHKAHIVPFGEFVPYGDMFPFLNQLIGMGRNLTRGECFAPIRINDSAKAGINICFEDIFPYVSRNETREGADFIIVITNDAWYPTSSEPTQHLANSIFRAIENRRPMIRCGNNSASCYILPNGIIEDTVFVSDEIDRRGNKILEVTKRGRGMANFSVYYNPDAPLTFYTRYGDAFILLCWTIFGAASLFSVLKWREKKTILMSKF